MAKSKTDRTADALTTKTPRLPAIRDEDLLSTGCTVLNVAISGRPFGAVPKGSMVSWVGASGSAKTWFSFCLFAEANINKHFDRYTFIHDNAENGALMDVEEFFGKGLVARLRPPRKGKEGSESAEEFYLNVEANVKKGPCIYVLDSMDAIRPESDLANNEAKLHYHETGKGADEIKGSMGAEKAKVNSTHLGWICNNVLRTNGSILVIINQTRAVMNARFAGMKTYGGGDALKFFSHIQVWTKVKAPVENRHRGKDREIGSLIAPDITKNRVNGREGNAPLVTFLRGYGVDDVGSNIAYLLDEKHWKKPAKDKTDVAAPKGRAADADDEEGGKGKVFHAPEFEFTGTAEELIKLVQDGGRERELAEIVAGVYREIITGSTPVRKPKY